jgi:hypothetical protein
MFSWANLALTCIVCGLFFVPNLIFKSYFSLVKVHFKIYNFCILIFFRVFHLFIHDMVVVVISFRIHLVFKSYFRFFVDH